MFACKYEYFEIVKLLVKNGANINEKNDIYNCNAKTYAYNYSEIVKFLEKNGANINEERY